MSKKIITKQAELLHIIFLEHSLVFSADHIFVNLREASINFETDLTNFEQILNF